MKSHLQKTAKTTNVTLRIDADLAREAKVLAAQRGSSLSQLMSDQLERLLRRARGYRSAEARALTRLGAGFDLGWSPPADREELYER